MYVGASQVAQLVKSPPANARDMGLILGSGRSPGIGNCNPLQYSYLENSMDREAWLATVHGVARSQTQLSNQGHNIRDIIFGIVICWRLRHLLVLLICLLDSSVWKDSYHLPRSLWVKAFLSSASLDKQWHKQPPVYKWATFQINKSSSNKFSIKSHYQCHSSQTGPQTSYKI